MARCFACQEKGSGTKSAKHKQFRQVDHISRRAFAPGFPNPCEPDANALRLIGHYARAIPVRDESDKAYSLSPCSSSSDFNRNAPSVTTSCPGDRP
jgi:hypothetical protein